MVASSFLQLRALAGAALCGWLCVFVFAESAFAQNANMANPPRVQSGLILACEFESPEKNLILDRSNLKPRLDFKIEKSDSIAAFSHGIEFKSAGRLQTPNIGPRIAAAVIRSGEVTLEAWIQPTKLDQAGPARIFTYSRNTNDRNFTLGQDGGKFDFRVRSTQTDNNGLPSLASKPDTVTTDLTHVVYTQDRTGRTRIYINGELNVEAMLTGDLTNWTADFPLAIGNEVTGERPWLGKIFLVAIYQRDLLPHEVRQNFRAGENAVFSVKGDPNQLGDDLFINKVAPMLARHCLECHSATKREGGLDLSNEESAFAGGDSGKVIHSKQPYESSLWTQVVADEMPQDRPPLDSKQKQILKDWIDSGAKWSGGELNIISAGEKKVSEAWVRRLTVSEYIATVKALAGVDIESEAREILPPELRADGFTNTAYNLNVDLKHIESYSHLAETIVARIDVASFAKKFAKTSDFSDENLQALIGGMGKLLFRSPLEDHELTTYLRIAETVKSTGGDYGEAATYILESMLQSPRFIYMVENQKGDGTRWPVGDYELASRLSYLLWGAPPDAELIAAVDRGEFYDRTGVESQVDRMLKDPRAITRSVDFLNQWLDLDGLGNLRPNRNRFPIWDPELAADMRIETIEFFKEVAWRQNRPLGELLNAQVTFATPRLARHYGLPLNVSWNPEAGDAVRETQRFDLSSTPGRGGLLTQGSVLTIGGDEASMVARGLFVLKDLLRGSVSDPPPCVDSTPVPSKPGLTQRKIAEERIANASCGGCHVKFEPLAFGLERFDGVGAYHATDEHGNALREDGTLQFPGDRSPKSFASTGELMDLLANSERVKQALTWKVIQFAVGRPLNSDDAKYVNQIHAAAESGGNDGATYQSLMKAIVLSELVQTIETEKRGSGNADQESPAGKQGNKK